jgi:hypothetical protein
MRQPARLLAYPAALLILLLSGPPATAQVFGPPAALNTNAGSDTGDDDYPQVTTDGAGSWVAVWDSYDSLGGTIGTDYDILFATTQSPNIPALVPPARALAGLLLVLTAGGWLGRRRSR